MARRLASLCVVVAASVVAGACGGGDSAREVVAEAPEKTVEKRSSRFAVEAVTRSGEAVTTLVGEGVFDFAAQRGRLALDLTGVGLLGRKADMLILGDVFYLNFPIEIPEAHGRPWLKLDIDDATFLSDINLGALSQLANYDPTGAVQFLRGVPDDVQKAGEEDVRGTGTEHYKARLDIDALSGRVPQQAQDDVARIRDVVGVRFVPTEAWVDEDGRLRRVRQSLDLSNVRSRAPTGQPFRGTQVITFELFDFGVNVDVAEPPADEVALLSDVARALVQRPPGMA
ncbi:MAG TPA: hypothetical protein VHE80_10200 [Acidimicrobiales bacterium]|nr:hypothetical protein [Acidimicrobiales bacterium]